ncbi:MAG: segregation/condensation protein A [Calditrichaeota bacterium]|nr:MAG: segregation/condensation protein A [Calditrichota bacterium]
MNQVYKIKLPVFEGPFDLLLYLIRRNELEITDIPIAEITRQYLEYIELMKILDLEVAGEFIEMVATLMLIKARMLLPRPESDELLPEEDPRSELVRQLLEYKRFKEAGEQLREREAIQRQHFPRPEQWAHQDFKKNLPPAEQEIDASLWDLLTAFKRALDNMPKVTYHQVQTPNVTIEDQVGFLFAQLEGKSFLWFSEVAAQIKEKLRLVVTFLALLDLVYRGFISVKQSSIEDDIRLVPRGPLSMSAYLELVTPASEQA